MKTLTPQQVLLLTIIQSGPKEGLTRYDIMIKFNQIISPVDHPYSPGALYPAINKLKTMNLIDSNHDTFKVTNSGEREIEAALLREPLPDSIFGIVTLVLAIGLSPHLQIKTEALKRIEINLIKNNHISSSGDSTISDKFYPTNIVVPFLVGAIQKVIIEMRANK